MNAYVKGENMKDARRLSKDMSLKGEDIRRRKRKKMKRGKNKQGRDNRLNCQKFPI